MQTSWSLAKDYFHGLLHGHSFFWDGGDPGIYVLMALSGNLKPTGPSSLSSRKPQQLPSQPTVLSCLCMPSCGGWSVSLLFAQASVQAPEDPATEDTSIHVLKLLEDEVLGR